MKNQVNRYEITLKKTLESVESFGPLNSSDKAAAFARQFYHENIELYESFFIVMCNNNLTPKAWAKISQGGTVGTIVDVKIVAKYASDSLADYIFLVHNHPSGKLVPSADDKRLTETIAGALRLFLSTRVADHIILTTDDYFSFHDNGLI